jgi:hypothetical protein
MDRKIPLLQLQDGEWRALKVEGDIAEPELAWGYMERSFKQMMGGVIGAMRLLGEGWDGDELNKR